MAVDDLADDDPEDDLVDDPVDDPEGDLGIGRKAAAPGGHDDGP